jgi:hypothetical protein
MELRIFKRYDRLIGWVVFAISAIVYLATIEPTASFWDCGEFIASSYKLEVGHPPGNPTFQLFGRLFSLFGNNTQAAMLINAMSALCSAFCVLFLFWPISHLGRRLLEAQSKALTNRNAIAVWELRRRGSYLFFFRHRTCFSAVEASVRDVFPFYRHGLLAMLKWRKMPTSPTQTAGLF